MDRTPVSGCYMRVDWTDCPIQEPTCFDPGWYCHKFNGAVMRYEVAGTGRLKKIVWINGPFLCGSMPDLLISRPKPNGILQESEFVFCDSGYSNGKCIRPSGKYHFLSSVHNSLRARQEAINSRLKTFKVLTK